MKLMNRRTAGVLANASLIVALVIFVAVVFFTDKKRDFVKASVSDDGTSFSISGIDFSRYDKTILLALDRDCRYCNEQAAFHQRLADEAGKKRVRVVALFQHDSSEGAKYLSKMDINAQEILRVKLSSLRIEGVPAVIVVNKAGHAIGKWEGGLSESLQTYLLEMLGKSEEMIREDDSPFLLVGNPRLIPLLDVEKLPVLIKENSVTFLDIDGRDEFAMQHIEGSLNIPRDEIYARALDELDPAKTIVVFSRHLIQHEVTSAFVNLRLTGHEKVLWLKQGLTECEARGLKLASGP